MGKTGKRKAVCLKELIPADIKIRKQKTEKINHVVKFTLFLISGYETKLCFNDLFFHSTSFAAGTPQMKGTVYAALSPIILFPVIFLMAVGAKKPFFIRQQKEVSCLLQSICTLQSSCIIDNISNSSCKGTSQTTQLLELNFTTIWSLQFKSVRF